MSSADIIRGRDGLLIFPSSPTARLFLARANVRINAILREADPPDLLQLYGSDEGGF